ncbi:hypothetical protein [Tenacibaculum sp. 190130A14a]
MSMEDKGVFQFGISYDYNFLNTLKEGNNTLRDNTRKRITHSALLNLSYNITNNWAFEVLLTWVNQKREISSAFGVNLSETTGIGDWVVLSRYKFVNNKTLSISSGIGLKLPTGKSDITSSNGIVFNADIQPGSNTLDYIVMSSLDLKTSFRESFSVFSRIVYRVTGENDQYQEVNRYKFGNELQFFLGATDQFLLFKQIFNPSISVKYRNAQRDLLNGRDIPNTGGDWIFLIPRFSLELTNRMALNSSVEVPIYANLKGIQLTPTYRFNVGIIYKFKKREKIL